MNPVIIVCGPNHSKTSQLMEILIEMKNDNFWFGDVSDDTHAVTPYKKYENKEFIDICKPTFNKNYVKRGNKTFKKFFAGLPKDKTVILKYPKSIFLMNDIKKAVGKRELRIIYVFRDINDVVISSAIKTEPKERLSVFENMARLLRITEYVRRSLLVSFKYDCFYCPITYFENYPAKPLNQRLYNYILKKEVS